MPFTVDVTTNPYNAPRDGKKDATKAIQRAIIDVSSHVDPDPENDTVHEGGNPDLRRL